MVAQGVRQATFYGPWKKKGISFSLPYLGAQKFRVGACNQNYMEPFLLEVGNLSWGDYTSEEMMATVKRMQSMYGCLGTSCEEIGTHAGGIGCEDNIADPIIPLAGYLPDNDVRSVSY